jgi:hypothetical protein
MEIQQEISNVVAAPSQTVAEVTSPTINQRQINSTGALASGATVGLGGWFLLWVCAARLGSPVPVGRMPFGREGLLGRPEQAGGQALLAAAGRGVVLTQVVG